MQGPAAPPSTAVPPKPPSSPEEAHVKLFPGEGSEGSPALPPAQPVLVLAMLPSEAPPPPPPAMAMAEPPTMSAEAEPPLPPQPPV